MWGLISLPLHRFPFFKDFFLEITTSILAKKKIQPEIQKKIWSKLIKSDQIWSKLIKSDQNRGFDQIWSDLISFDQIWSDFCFWIFLISLRIFFVQSWFGMFRLKFWAKVCTKKLKQILKSWIFICVFPFLSVFFRYVCFFCFFFFCLFFCFSLCFFSVLLFFSWFFLCLFFSLS